ncbi:hypothetical protein FRC12_017704 [Ceratobasidium sp. 428]|nr:hypothetical protein FRC12_017704 [Ceratobasidium sp. 428]
MLAGPIPNDSYIKTLVAQYDRELFGEGGYRKFVADSACEIDLTDLWDTEAPSSPDKTASSPDKAHGRCKRHRGLVLASRGQPPSGSGSKAYKFASPYPTVSPNAAAVRSALLYRRSEEGDMNESVTTNDSIPACEPRDPPVARLPASPPSTDVSSTDLVSPTPPPKSVLRTGVLPSLPSCQSSLDVDSDISKGMGD